jgi:hypothetical protein
MTFPKPVHPCRPELIRTRALAPEGRREHPADKKGNPKNALGSFGPLLTRWIQAVQLQRIYRTFGDRHRIRDFLG